MTRAPEPGERAEVDAGPVVPPAEAGTPSEPTGAEPTGAEPTAAGPTRADDLVADVRPPEVPSDEAAWERAARATAHEAVPFAGDAPDDAPGDAPADEAAPPTRLVPRVAPAGGAPEDGGPALEPPAADTAAAVPTAARTDQDDDTLDAPHGLPGDASDDVLDGASPPVRRAVLPPGRDPWEASAPGARADLDVHDLDAHRDDLDHDDEGDDARGDDAADAPAAAGHPDEVHGPAAEAPDPYDPAWSVSADVAPEPVPPAASEPVPPAASGPVPADGTGAWPALTPVAPAAAAAPVPGDGPPPDAWRTLGRSLRPRVNRAQVLAGLLCGMLGFAVVVQVRQTHDEGLSTLRQSELVGILDQTTRQGDELEREADSLERTRQKLLSGSTSSQAALDAAMSSAATQGILAGRLPAEGPGLTITVADPDRVVAARSLLNLLEELRNAGAEAVQLNDLRITASSFVVEGEGRGVVVDGVAVEPPYRWLVIGDPSTMENAMEIPGGAFATIRNDGGRPTAVQQDELSILATRTVPEPRFATPLAPEEG